ncbi:MAG: helix-turn-helix transcriptional regulator [Chitinophagaceae bacterium]
MPVDNNRKQEFCKAFGRHFRKLREEKGYGMREFAKMAEIEYSQLSKIERGVTNPTISTVLVLANALGASHHELFNFKFPARQSKEKL